jgi:adenylate cyclase
VKAALDMIRTQDGPLAEELVARGWPKLKFGIGLNTGEMSVGNMGSTLRLAYTALSDAVNLGSRVESLTKQYGLSVMITEYTQAAVPDLISREVDLVRVKGKDTPVRLFEPLGFADEVGEETRGLLVRHQAALVLFRGQQWTEARAAFEQLAVLEPERKLYRIYLDRIEHFMEESPGPDWDGVYTHKEK